MTDSSRPSKCTVNSAAPSPHRVVPLTPPPKICNTILDHIGNTPMVRLSNIMAAEGLQCELLAKCEYFNAGGSVKDRIGKRMVEDAEISGRLQQGHTVIEPTSGNTGIGLALACAIKGYRAIITLPEKMSQEKVNVLRALGAEIVRTPTEAAWDAPESHIGVAMRLNKEIPNSHILNQYTNPGNPLAHYDGTAEEIYNQCDGKLDVIVMGAGTGGTVTGIARKLKERIPNVKVVGVDPVGSILAEPESLNVNANQPYAVEGIGYDFIPTVLDRTLVDRWIKTTDKESLLMARRLIREEGLLCGGSSGTAVVAALQVAKELGPGQRCVVLLPDSTRNYMTKFLNDDWMIERGFMERQTEDPLGNATIADLHLRTPITISSDVTCAAAVAVLRENGIDNLPVLRADGSVAGLVTLGNLLSRVSSGQVKSTDLASKVMFKFSKKKAYTEITDATPLATLRKFFDIHSVAFVTEGENRKIKSVVTKIDLLNFLVKQGK
ncbi:pyridoxal-phosphate dependent enzyme [Capsaspora owczarzaki ATCC 30864]|uniref:Cystathionine beta-synthase n=1 Tax=Capsaspora owczarzaki (strain ATCC 30864) TaxID=595528 RepID=A0A0D2UQU7_CAPO3|nr:pyridoxal-phosphate dependent enzyme [Capsaspora owczarzaki ATCC 30864]KJE97396.1 pyridoxal-phosphate dependent enzyme [Capsaspora owczarzaki ATCC 30864]|eukprot:XP_004343124.1 pyridoxal-phosphate dependent enzyme [Capsaspora owczarzaki ATCC 30864]